MKLSLKLLVLALLLNSSILFAQQKGENPDTTLVQNEGVKAQYADLLRFQAEERKVLFQQLSEEKRALQAEFQDRKSKLMETQKSKRKEFNPSQHSVEERRSFFVGQRQELNDLREEEKRALQAMRTAQTKRLGELHSKQKEERSKAKKH